MAMIRNCGFNPVSHMMNKGSDTEPSWYLLIMWRVAWFNAYCAEHGITGMIDDSEIQLVGTSPALFWQATAKVYMDGKLVAQSTAATPVVGSDGMIDSSACQTAGTYAKGRALANLGFGTEAVLDELNLLPAEAASELNSIGCDAGINPAMFGTPNAAPVPNPTPAPAPASAAPVYQQPQPREVSPQQPAPAPASAAPVYQQPQSREVSPQQQAPVTAPPVQSEPIIDIYPVQPQPAPVIPAAAEPAATTLRPVFTGTVELTVSGARAVIVPNGKYKGRPLGDIMLENPGYASWVLGKPEYCARFPQLAEACRVLMPA